MRGILKNGMFCFFKIPCKFFRWGGVFRIFWILVFPIVLDVFIISSQCFLIMFHKLFPTTPHFIPYILSKVLLLEPVWVDKRGKNINSYYFLHPDFRCWFTNRRWCQLRGQHSAGALAGNQLLPNAALKRSEKALIDLVDGPSSGSVVLVDATDGDLVDHDARLGGGAAECLPGHDNHAQAIAATLLVVVGVLLSGGLGDNQTFSRRTIDEGGLQRVCNHKV
jgi:hypothetical protein